MTPDPVASLASSDGPSGCLEGHTVSVSKTWKVSGQRLRLRPIRHDDDALEEAFVRGLSTETAYHRMLSGGVKVTPEWIRSLTHVDYRRHMALVVTTGTGATERFVGVGRYVADPATCRAEFALVIADAWQRHGIGRRLLDALLDQARKAGVREMDGIVLASNKPMLALARSAGFTIEPEPDDATVVRVRRSLIGLQTH
jgi:acetyltransferase